MDWLRGSSFTSSGIRLKLTLPMYPASRRSRPRPCRIIAGCSRDAGTIQSRAGSRAIAEPTTAASWPCTGPYVPARLSLCSLMTRSSIARESIIRRMASAIWVALRSLAAPSARVPSTSSSRNSSVAATPGTCDLFGTGLATLKTPPWSWPRPGLGPKKEGNSLPAPQAGTACRGPRLAAQGRPAT